MSSVGVPNLEFLLAFCVVMQPAFIPLKPKGQVAMMRAHDLWLDGGRPLASLRLTFGMELT